MADGDRCCGGARPGVAAAAIALVFCGACGCGKAPGSGAPRKADASARPTVPATGPAPVAEESGNDAGPAAGDAPDSVHALLGRAKALCDEGNQQRAIAAFSKAISLQPDLAEAYHGRGLARQDAGENDLAIADFTKAIDLRPDFTEALNARGLTHLLKCDYARTKRDLREVIKLDPYGETGASAKENLELLGPQ